MSLDSSTLASLTPFITSLVALGTLWNVSKQRIISNRPDIHFKSKAITIRYNNKKEFPDIESRKGGSLDPAIFNIGMGTAKSIKVQWLMSESVFEKLKKYDIKNQYSFESIGGDNNKFWTIKKIDEKLEVGVRLPISYEIDFVLPYKTNDEPEEYLLMHPLVNYIYGIYSELLYNNFVMDDKEIKEYEDFNIKIVMSYKDIGGKFYSNFYKMKVDYYHHSKMESTANFQLILSK